MPEAELLRAEGLRKSFGGVTALNGVDLKIRPGEIVSVIGPNGAGKTTLFNVLTGVCRPDEGRVRMDGRRLDAEPPHRIVARGIARTFQNIRLFANMTVLENAMVGGHSRRRLGLLPTLLRLPSFHRSEREMIQEARAALAFVGLARQEDKLARDLPYGDQRRLEIARALASRPRLLLLDEPTAGMNPAECEQITRLVSRLRESGITILLIEHRMSVVMGISDRVVVLNFGAVIREGSPKEVREDPAVIEAYLGRSHA